MSVFESMFSLTGKVAVVTGCSRGIGAALALSLAQAGSKVVLAVRNRESAIPLCQQMDVINADYDIVIIDVSSVTSIQHGFAEIAGKYAQIDILVNNAGIEQVTESLELSESVWDLILDTNLKGAFFCAQAAAKQMQKKGGSIINLCSLTSEVGVPGAVPYGASKTGMVGITRALATEWAKYGIRVNGIGPGYFKTDLTAVFYENEAWCASMREKIPLGRFGEMDDLTGVVLFLASNAARYITGQVIYADGGYLAGI